MLILAFCLFWIYLNILRQAGGGFNLVEGLGVDENLDSPTWQYMERGVSCRGVADLEHVAVLLAGLHAVGEAVPQLQAGGEGPSGGQNCRL